MARKLYATVGDHEFELAQQSDGSWAAEGAMDTSIVNTSGNVFSLLLDGRSYQATLLEQEGSTSRIRVGKNTYEVQLQDEDSRRVQELGLDLDADTAEKEIHAPMPGLVLSILVEAGQPIKKGDGVLILEAMKMENMIKAPADGVLKAVHAKQGEAVEKGQLLIELE